MAGSRNTMPSRIHALQISDIVAALQAARGNLRVPGSSCTAYQQSGTRPYRGTVVPANERSGYRTYYGAQCSAAHASIVGRLRIARLLGSKLSAREIIDTEFIKTFAAAGQNQYGRSCRSGYACAE